MTLIDQAREHVEALVADLEDEDDFMPFLTYNGIAQGEPSSGYVGLQMPENEQRNDIADVMMAILAIYRATEAVFASVTWAVKTATADELDVMPSEHPDRVEQVFMIHVTPDGDAIHSARVTRVQGRVQLGDWEAIEGLQRVGGRFADAIHNGITMGAQLPPEMITFIDARVADDQVEELVGPFLRAMRTIRGTAPEGELNGQRD